jgi:hypothetical protein
VAAVLRDDIVFGHAIDDGHVRPEAGGKPCQHVGLRHAASENRQRYRPAALGEQLERADQVRGALHAIPRAAEQRAGATRACRAGGIEKAVRYAVRDHVDTIGRQPPAGNGELPIGFVQHDQAMREPGCGGYLPEPRRRIPDAAAPRFGREPRVAVLDHAAVVQVLETVGSADERRGGPGAETLPNTEPQALRAGDVDHVVGRPRQRTANSPGRKRGDHQLAELTAGRM